MLRAPRVPLALAESLTDEEKVHLAKLSGRVHPRLAPREVVAIVDEAIVYAREGDGAIGVLLGSLLAAEWVHQEALVLKTQEMQAAMADLQKAQARVEDLRLRRSR